MKSLILIIIMTISGVMVFAKDSAKAKSGIKQHLLGSKQFRTPASIGKRMLEARVKHLTK